MNALKEGWALLLMVLSLLCVPEKSLSFWLSDRPQDWYGEITIAGGDRDYVLAKNRSERAIDLRERSARLLGARALAGDALDVEGTAGVLPESSYVLVSEDHATSQEPRRRKFADSAAPFAPPPLYISTEAEGDLAILLLFVGASLMAGLGFSIGLYFREAGEVQTENTLAHRQRLRE